MYPDFQYLFQSLFGAPMPEWLGIFKTFGFFVALAFIAAAWTAVQELKRKEKLGLLLPTTKTITGKDGNTKQVTIWPHERVSEIVIFAAIGGIVGAKVFNALETWEDFIANPIDNLFSRSGLTFYGGLIVATAVLYYYARRHKINFIHLCDALAPGLMLAYGVGRLGCHFSGDGDWGIYNTAYVTQADGTLRLATAADQNGILHNINTVQHTHFVAPDWLPRWVVGMNYPHNIIGEGMRIEGCTGTYCTALPVAVFPTAIYEAITCTLLFFFLWSIRKKIVKPLHLFGIYLILNGLERFFVELIRVNYKYDWGFIHPTQAEIISTTLVLAGIGILLFFKRKPEPTVSV